MLTSSVRPEDESRCLQMGCRVLFKKPVSLLEYIDLAEKILLLT